ncbi:MAG: MtaA/CmuA family methyltransferase [Archaeoglobaceae archaeon]
MSPKRRVLAALMRGSVDYTPASSATTLGIRDAMAVFNAYYPTVHKDPEKMAKLGASLWELAKLEVARVPFCLTVVAEAMGCGINWGTEVRQPSVSKHLPIDQIKLPDDLLERGRIPVVRESIKILRKSVGDFLPILVGFEGPFTLAGHLVGTEKLLGMCITEPNKVKEILDVATEALIIVLKDMIKAGADYYVIPDPTAAPDVLDPSMFKEFVVPKHLEITENVGAPSILHICGDVKKILPHMAECGYNGLSIEEVVDLLEARKIIGEDIALVGNVSTKKTLPFGKPEEVKAEAFKALESGVDILAPGCGIPPITPLQNIVAFVEAAREYAEKKGRKVKTTSLLAAEILKEEERRRSQNPEELIRDMLPKEEPFKSIAEAVFRGEAEKVSKLVKEALKKYNAKEVVDKGLTLGMNAVTKLYENGVFYLPQVVLAANAMQEGIKILEELSGESKVEKKGKVVMHVAEGDLHDLGKNLAKAFLIADGWEVIDLGKDVPVDEVVKAVEKYKPVMVTGTALMTTTMTAFPKIAQKLIERGIEVPFICGGGPITEEFVKTFPLGIVGKKAYQAPKFAEAAKNMNWKEIRDKWQKIAPV